MTRKALDGAPGEIRTPGLLIRSQHPYIPTDSLRIGRNANLKGLRFVAIPTHSIGRIDKYKSSDAKIKPTCHKITHSVRDEGYPERQPCTNSVPQMRDDLRKRYYSINERTFAREYTHAHVESFDGRPRFAYRSLSHSPVRSSRDGSQPAHLWQPNVYIGSRSGSTVLFAALPAPDSKRPVSKAASCRS